MSTAFETFVNDELPNRIGTQEATNTANHFPQYTGTAKLTTERSPAEVLADIGGAAAAHTHLLSAVTDSGALAALDTVDTAQIDALAVEEGEIANNAVTLGKMATIAANSIMGNDTAGELEPKVLTGATLSTPTASDLFLGWKAGGLLRTFKVDSIPHDSLAGASGLTNDHGAIDTHISASGALAELDTVSPAEIDAEAVGVAKMTASQTDVFFGRTTAAAGPGEELDKAAALAILGVTEGADVGDVVGPGSSVDGNIVLFDGATGKAVKDGLVAPGAFYRIDGTVALTASLALGATSREFLNQFGGINLALSGASSSTNHVKLSAQSTGSAAVVSAAGVDANIDLQLDPKGTGVLHCADSRIQHVIAQDTHFVYMQNPTGAERMELRLLTAPTFQVEAIWATIAGGTDLTIELGKIDWDANFSTAPTSILSSPLVAVVAGASDTTEGNFTNIDGAIGKPQILVLTTTANTGTQTDLRVGIKFRMERE